MGVRNRGKMGLRKRGTAKARECATEGQWEYTRARESALDRERVRKRGTVSCGFCCSKPCASEQRDREAQPSPRVSYLLSSSRSKRLRECASDRKRKQGKVNDCINNYKNNYIDCLKCFCCIFLNTLLLRKKGRKEATKRVRKKERKEGRGGKQGSKHSKV